MVSKCRSKICPKASRSAPRELHDLAIGQEPVAAVGSFQEPGIACHYLFIVRHLALFFLQPRRSSNTAL